MSFADRISAKLQFGSGKRAKFYEQLISLMKSKVARLDAIKMIHHIETMEGKRPTNGSAPALMDIIRRIEDGDTFGDAISRWVPRNEAMVLRAIEHSRNFPESLATYLDLEKRRRAMIGSVKSGLIQPIFSLSVGFGVVLYMGGNVMPIMADLLPMDNWSGMAYMLALLSYFAEGMALPMVVSIIVTAILIRLSFPRWAGWGRRVADKMPFYSMYRRLAGIDFLVALSSLTSGGMRMVDAIEQLMESSTPYVKHRLQLTMRRLLEGEKIGSALHATRMGFPDPDINLQLKILEETQDITAAMGKIADETLDQASRKIGGTMKSISIVSMGLVTIIISIISFGIVALNSQISETVAR